MKCGCIEGTIVNGTSYSKLYSFALHQPPDHKIIKTPRFKLCKKINLF